eukprot:TRINITY_DN132828_c2_g1_i2.p1 TRINITY_DN132828_c2_g1~~TRINITY_DN132828_c2_g1_i2.p1  ORF type:complete len:434 (+),score=74.76 TRINITY_DN132828_c2_g1_i2:24-1325(+)
MKIQLCVIILILFGLSEAKIQTLKIRGDTRTIYNIENFGFTSSGVARFNITNYVGDGNGEIVLRKVSNRDDGFMQTENDFQLLRQKPGCGRLYRSNDLITHMNKTITDEGPIVVEYHFTSETHGLYQMIFRNCDLAPHSYDLHLVFTSSPGHYLSAGQVLLPYVHFTMVILFIGAFVGWVYMMSREKTKVHKVHHLMSALVIFKILSELFEGASLLAMDHHGKPDMWNSLFYILYFAKAMLLIIVVFLIGIGWSIIKSGLTKIDRSVLLIVLPLQFIVNIAYIFLQEAAPGSIAQLNIRDLMTFLDIISCCVLIIPIGASVQQLARSSIKDKSKRQEAVRVMQFRSYYGGVVAYIATTRFLMDVVEILVPYHMEWTAVAFGEVVALAFYCFTGILFRPKSENAYMQLGTDEDGEFGLEAEESDTELQNGIEMV